jgi:hypothetical protein
MQSASGSAPVSGIGPSSGVGSASMSLLPSRPEPQLASRSPPPSVSTPPPPSTLCSGSSSLGKISTPMRPHALIKQSTMATALQGFTLRESSVPNIH